MWSYRCGGGGRDALISVPRHLQDGSNGIKFQVLSSKLSPPSSYTTHYYYTAKDQINGTVRSMSLNARVVIDADRNIDSILNYEVGARVAGSSIWRKIPAKIYVQVALTLKAFPLDFGSYMTGSGEEIKTSTQVLVDGRIDSDVTIELENQDIVIENSKGDKLPVRLGLDGQLRKNMNLGKNGEEQITLDAEVVETPTNAGNYYGSVKIYATYI